MRMKSFVFAVMSFLLLGCNTTEPIPSSTSEIDHSITVYFMAKSPDVDWVSDGEFTYHIHYWGNGRASNWNALPTLNEVSDGLYSYTFQPTEMDDYAPSSLLFLRKTNHLSIFSLLIIKSLCLLGQFGFDLRAINIGRSEGSRGNLVSTAYTSCCIFNAFFHN